MTGQDDDKIELKDIRKTLWWGDPSEYRHRIRYYKANRFDELEALGFDFEREYSEDYWREKTRDAWLDREPETPEEVFRFYSEWHGYIPELVVRQAEVVDDIRQCYYWLRENGARSVLDYGAGAGDFSMYMAYKGLDAVYADVDGVLPEFADLRYKARGDVDVDIRPIESPDSTPADVVNAVDAAICLEVIEHLPDPESVIDGFSKAINPGGVLITSWTFTDWSDDDDDVYTPCHINLGSARSREVAEYVQRDFEEIDFTWNKQLRLWRRK